MSQYSCQCTTRSGRAVRVVAGYDRRLDELFLQVHDELDEDSPEEDDDAVYFFAPPGWTSVQSIAGALARLEITVPPTFIAGIEEDQRNCAGNRVVRHRFDGDATVVHAG